MFAVGHLALGYITGKVADILLKVKSNIFLLLLVSVIPDIDILIPALEHRGPTHNRRHTTTVAFNIPYLWHRHGDHKSSKHTS